MGRTSDEINPSDGPCRPPGHPRFQSNLDHEVSTVERRTLFHTAGLIDS